MVIIEVGHSPDPPLRRPRCAVPVRKGTGTVFPGIPPPSAIRPVASPATKERPSAMKKDAMLVEYGAPIDPQLMVTPLDVTELELEPGHPGLGDAEYIRRRKELFAL